MQSCNEFAAVFSTNASGEISDSYVILKLQGQEVLQYSYMDPNVEPWIYPLFYPHGNKGWHQDIIKKKFKQTGDDM